MYSLYRAWFGDATPTDNYPPRIQETLSPPDTVVRVGNEGEHQFVAHKGVLAAHSGYLKALLASATATSSSTVSSSFGPCSSLSTTTTAVSTGQSSREPVTSVSVSSIGGEAFAPLLNYMYTGRLEVTLDNVYSVLLATHLLHMPGALEQCRAALLRLRGPPHLIATIPVPGSTTTPTSTPTSGSISPSASGSSNILRPIPSRVMMGPNMCWPPPAPLYAPTTPATATVGIPHLPQLQPSVLMQSSVPPAVSVIPIQRHERLHEASNSIRYSSIQVPSPKSSPTQQQQQQQQQRSLGGPRIDSRPRSPDRVSPVSLPFVAAAAAAFGAFAVSTATTSTTRTPSPTQSVSPSRSTGSMSPSPLRRNKKLTSTEQQNQQRQQQQSRANEEREDQNDTLHSEGQVQYQRTSTTSEEDIGSYNRDNNTGVISGSEIDRNNRSSRRRGRTSTSNGNDNSNVLSVVYDVACCDGPVRFHRVLNENYCGSAPQPGRVQRPCLDLEAAAAVSAAAAAAAAATAIVPSENDENGGPVSARGVCNSNDSATATSNDNGSYTCGYCRHTFKSQYCYRKHAKRHLLPTRVNESSNNRQRPDTSRNRREVRLLDLNVQYYPCKICGCKFPSYYFVHKHRKLCHANVEERPATDTTSNATEKEPTVSTIHELQ